MDKANEAVTTRSAPSFAKLSQSQYLIYLIVQLVAGSGATEESDERAHGPGGVAEVDIAKSVEVGHHGEGIPGPITRLFVVANRGLANLVQDLILVNIPLLY